MKEYSITTEEFDARLQTKVTELGAAWLFTLPGVYEIVSEELNNDILTEWELENADNE